MAPLGDLTIAGLLYEGDHARWLPRINSLLRANDLGHYTSENVNRFGRACEGEEYENQRQLATALIRSTLSPQLRKRLNDVCIKPSQFYRLLEDMTQPFRLLDLPAEMRVLIYEHAMGGDRQQLHPNRPSAPALLQVSHHIRSEAKPIWYAATLFEILILDEMDSVKDLACLFKHVQNNVLGENIRHLTRINIELTLYDITHPETFEFSYDHRNGLELKFPDNLAAESQQELNDFISEEAAQNRLWGLEGGGAIMKAIMARPKMWKLGELEYDLWS